MKEVKYINVFILILCFSVCGISKVQAGKINERRSVDAQSKTRDSNRVSAPSITGMRPELLDQGTMPADDNGLWTVIIRGSGFDVSNDMRVTFKNVTNGEVMRLRSFEAVDRNTIKVAVTEQEISARFAVTVQTNTGGVSNEFSYFIQAAEDDSGNNQQRDDRLGNSTTREAAGGYGGGVEWNEGDIVAVLDMENPSFVDTNEYFVLHGVVPVPEGFFPRADGLQPFQVLEEDGTAVPAQFEPITYYPNGDVNSGEVIARVRKASESNGRLQYRVIASAHELTGDQGVGMYLLKRLPNINAFVKDNLLDDITLHTKDYMGNPYSIDITAHNPKSLRTGYYNRTVRTHFVMTPDLPNPSSGLPHMMGVHAYISTLPDVPIVLVDLRIHNGLSGFESNQTMISNTNLDDAYEDLFFKNLEMEIPEQCSVVEYVNNPNADLTGFSVGNNRKRVKIVKEEENNKLHLIESLGQFHRRLAIACNGSEDTARGLLELESLAFAQYGVNSQTGHDYFSWQSIAGYWQMRERLPKAVHLQLSAIRNQLQQEFEDIRYVIESGIADGFFEEPVMGPYHPYERKYGGGTGNDNIAITAGARTAIAGSRYGVLKSMLLARATYNRNKKSFYNLDGTFMNQKQLIENCPSNSEYDKFQNAQFEHHGMPYQLDKDNPWGFGNPAYNHRNQVIGLGLAPWYMSRLKDYDNIDFQHYTRSLKNHVSIYLAGDRMLVDDAFQEASAAEISQTIYPRRIHWQNTCRAIEVGDLLSIKESVQEYPNIGAYFGRGTGWRAQAMARAYQLTNDPEYREFRKPWFENLIDTMRMAQIPCSGFIGAHHNHNSFFFADPNPHEGNQTYETSFLIKGVMAVRNTVFEGVDEQKVNKIDNMLEDLRSSLLLDPFFTFDTSVGFYRAIATRNKETKEPYCVDVDQWSGDMFVTSGFNATNTYDIPADHYLLTGDESALIRAHQMAEGVEQVSNESLLDKIQDNYGISGSGHWNDGLNLLRMAEELEGL